MFFVCKLTHFTPSKVVFIFYIVLRSNTFYVGVLSVLFDFAIDIFVSSGNYNYISQTQ